MNVSIPHKCHNFEWAAPRILTHFTSNVLATQMWMDTMYLIGCLEMGMWSLGWWELRLATFLKYPIQSWFWISDCCKRGMEWINIHSPKRAISIKTRDILYTSKGIVQDFSTYHEVIACTDSATERNLHFDLHPPNNGNCFSTSKPLIKPKQNLNK